MRIFSVTEFISKFVMILITLICFAYLGYDVTGQFLDIPFNNVDVIMMTFGKVPFRLCPTLYRE